MANSLTSHAGTYRGARQRRSGEIAGLKHEHARMLWHNGFTPLDTFNGTPAAAAHLSLFLKSETARDPKHLGHFTSYSEEAAVDVLDNEIVLIATLPKPGVWLTRVRVLVFDRNPNATAPLEELRATTQGDSLARTLDHLGYDVTDWLHEYRVERARLDEVNRWNSMSGDEQRAELKAKGDPRYAILGSSKVRKAEHQDEEQLERVAKIPKKGTR